MKIKDIKKTESGVDYPVVYATDFDRTVIFSKRCIDEYHKSNERLLVVERTPNYVSYALEKYVNGLKKLPRNILFVPVTSRSIDEYLRVKLSKYAKYAIVTNGCHILYNGKIYQPYERHLADFYRAFNKFASVALDGLRSIGELDKDPRVIDNAYMFAKLADQNVDTTKKIEEFNQNNRLVQIERNGRKLYATPKNINKGTALEWLMKHLELEGSLAIASGDSVMDISFLRLADIVIVPEHATLWNNIPADMKGVTMTAGGPSGSMKALNMCEIFVY